SVPAPHRYLRIPRWVPAPLRETSCHTAGTRRGARATARARTRFSHRRASEPRTVSGWRRYAGGPGTRPQFACARLGKPDHDHEITHRGSPWFNLLALVVLEHTSAADPGLAHIHRGIEHDEIGLISRGNEAVCRAEFEELGRIGGSHAQRLGWRHASLRDG